MGMVWSCYRPRSEGYVFTGICLFKFGGCGSALLRVGGGLPSWQGGGSLPSWQGRPPPKYIFSLNPPPPVNERAVRILLDCILVFYKNVAYMEMSVFLPCF